MNQLKAQNPQMFQQISQLRANGANPKAILQQMVGNSTPEQMQNILGQARNFGVPDDVLTQIQNMKR